MITFQSRCSGAATLPQSFNLLRYFNWTSLILVVFTFVATGMVVVYVVHMAHKETEEDEADSLAEAVVGMIKPLGFDQKTWPANPAAQQIQKEMASLCGNFDIVEFDLFSPDGTQLVCSRKHGGAEEPLWQYGFEAACNGTAKTRWDAEHWWKYLIAEGRHDIVSTYAPVKDEGKVIAVSRLRRDLTKTLLQTRAALPRLMLLAALVSLTVLLVLRITVRRADQTIHEQHKIIEDIHQRLEERNEFLEEYDKRKDEFLSICSHDIRSPLMGVLAGCQVLQKEKKGPLNETQREIIAHCTQSAQSVVALTEALLDLARIENGTEALNLELFDPVQVVRESLQAHQTQAESRSVTFELRAPKDAITIQGDKLKFLRVCNNLVSNAVKHSSQGVVRVNVERNACSVVIAVIDCGKGIKEEDIALLFDRFTSLSRRKRTREEGTGLGLSITRALVELHGGQIAVSSKEGKGATFTVILPLAIQARDAATTA